MSNYTAADMSTAAANGHRDGYQAGYADAMKAFEAAQPAAAQEAVAYWLAVDDRGFVAFGMSADDGNQGGASRQEVNDDINRRLNRGEPLLHLIGTYAAAPITAALPLRRTPQASGIRELFSVLRNMDCEGRLPAEVQEAWDGLYLSVVPLEYGGDMPDPVAAAPVCPSCAASLLYECVGCSVSNYPNTSDSPVDTWFADQLTAMGEVMPLDSAPAAPELLEALNMALARLKEIEICNDISIPNELREAARAAIAKASTPAAPGIDPADPWRGLYAPELMPKLDGVDAYHVAHPDLPSWPKGEDEERGVSPLVKAQGFELEAVFGEYPEDDDEDPDYCAWLAQWQPTPPAGDHWRLVCIQDTEDGPAAFYVRPFALIDASPKGGSFPWENFPAYLIDKCEGDTISEEGLQRAVAEMVKDPRYAMQATSAEVGSWPLGNIDGCTESNCKRCRTHPNHRGEMEHAGIGWRPGQPTSHGVGVSDE